MCLVLLLAGCDDSREPGRGDVERVTVSHVADGDTLTALDGYGDRIRVRILGIDAPEIAHEGRAAECGADASRKALEDLVLKQQVVLVGDPRSERTDRYGRRLAYVELDGVDVGRRQVGDGYAGAWYPARAPRPDRASKYEEDQIAAKGKRAGAWAACGTLGR